MGTLDRRRADAIKKNAQKRSIEDWIVILYKIYQNHNRGCDPFELWLQVINDASQLGETIRRELIRTRSPEDMNVYKQLARLFGRISSFIGRYIYDFKGIERNDTIGGMMKKAPLDDYIGGDEKYEKWILLKYPYSCPTCGNCPCICASHRNIMENRTDAGYDGFWEKHRAQFRGKKRKYAFSTDGQLSKNANKMYNSPIENWINMFKDIYAAGHIEVSLESIGFHFLEEVGEVSDGLLWLNELSKYRHRRGVYNQGAIDILEVLKVKAQRENNYRAFWEEYKQKIFRKKKTEKNKITINYLLDINMSLIKEELADVFSWMCAILNKIEALTKNWNPDYKPQPFSDALDQHYKLSSGEIGCRYCASEICKDSCIIGSVIRKSRDKRLNKLDHRLFS